MSNKRDIISEAVGKGLEELFGAVEASRGGSNGTENVTTESAYTMEFRPTDGGVVVSSVSSGVSATGEELNSAMTEFFETQAFLDNDRAIFEAMRCKHCGMAPCVFQAVYDNLVVIAEELENEKKSNKEIRFALYRHMSTVYNGYLGAGNRKKLPLCVEGDIRDWYPRDAGTEYVGFKEAGSDYKEE